MAKIDVLVLDDWAAGAIDAGTLADLLEIIDARCAQRATTHSNNKFHRQWVSRSAMLAYAILGR